MKRIVILSITTLASLLPIASAQVLPEFEDAETSNADTPSAHEQISPFIRRIFQDNRGDLWLGTNGDGVVQCTLAGDDTTLTYHMPHSGFGGHAVRAMLEDADGAVWFGTNGGISMYDGASFTNYTEKDGLRCNDVWCMTLDSEGLLWIGTLEGVARFDGETFTTFDLPASEPDQTRGVTSPWIVHSIIEDAKGRMWFAVNGGVYIWDGTALEHLSTKDGLCHDVVNCILESDDGTMWFATHHNGVCAWDGESFTHFGPEHGVQGSEAWDLFQDDMGAIWFPVEGFGLYRVRGEDVRNFSIPDGLATTAPQSTFQDRTGRIWVGGWLGLYRLDGDTFVNVTCDGPWPR
ncbi:MAG: two-component regulator propeller domain-containing protein [Planctomycetota bacterium]